MNEHEIMFLPPGVGEEFAEGSTLGFGYVTADDVRSLLIPRSIDAHKGIYGHALLICGSRGMSGAAALSVGAALRSGCGLVTIHLPESERFPVAANFPSALYSLDDGPFFTSMPCDMSKYSVVGVGCGLGVHEQTAFALGELLEYCTAVSMPMVVDADALNLIAADSGLRRSVPRGSVLTPHLGELRRLVGEWSSEEHKIDLASALAAEMDSIIVVKGPNTAIFDCGRSVVFNSTGNSGMAKGGSGDVLTGFITGLLARGYDPYSGAVLGVYLHGLAGDKAMEYFGAEAMNSGDIIEFLPEAWKEIE